MPPSSRPNRSRLGRADDCHGDDFSECVGCHPALGALLFPLMSLARTAGSEQSGEGAPNHGRSLPEQSAQTQIRLISNFTVERSTCLKNNSTSSTKMLLPCSNDSGIATSSLLIRKPNNMRPARRSTGSTGMREILARPNFSCRMQFKV